VPLADVNDVYTDLVTTVFSSPIVAKVWLATIALGFAVVQVLTGARMYGKLPFLSLLGSRTPAVHRWSGRLAILFTLPVIFHCVTILGFQTPDARVAVHSVAGTFVYGVFVAKMLVVRDRSLPGWALPVAGATMASTLAVLWLTSSLWYFTNVEFGF
jgi:hypothetical protein